MEYMSLLPIGVLLALLLDRLPNEPHPNRLLLENVVRYVALYFCETPLVNPILMLWVIHDMFRYRYDLQSFVMAMRILSNAFCLVAITNNIVWCVFATVLVLQVGRVVYLWFYRDSVVVIRE